jgi:copper homeostasis protein
MLRPRPGAFYYNATEYRVLLRDLDLFLSHGADGLVFGILNKDATIDRDRCREMVRQAAGHPVVFHRAMDLTPEPMQALEMLVDLGVSRVMTSGQKPTALAGASCIALLARLAAGRIEILPAGGINSGNVLELLRQTSCDQVHGSLRGTNCDPSARGRPELTFSGPMPAPGLYEGTDLTLVKYLREKLDTLGNG